MKKSEREELKKAFNIPEPERKEYFVSLYSEKVKKNKFNLSVFFHYASTVVFAIFLIGLWGNISKSTDFIEKFTDIDESSTEVQVTTTVLTEQTENIIETVTSSVVSTEISVQTSDSVQSTALQTITNNVQSSSIKTEVADTVENPPVTSLQTVQPVTAVNTTATRNVTVQEEIIVTSFNQTTVQSARTTAATVIPTDTEENFDPAPIIATTSKAVICEPTVTTAASAPTTTKTVICVPAVTTEPSENKVPAVEACDLTVVPPVIYSKSDNIIEITENGTDAVDNHISIDELINSSDYIIFGKVDEIIYTQLDGMPYTQENITIYEVYKGSSLCTNTKISIYVPGGYMPWSEYASMNNIELSYDDDTCVHSSGGNKTEQIVGDIRLFFIKNGDYTVPGGAYELTTKTDVSVFQARSGEYISQGDNSLKIKLDSLLNI